MLRRACALREYRAGTQKRILDEVEFGQNFTFFEAAAALNIVLRFVLVRGGDTTMVFLASHEFRRGKLYQTWRRRKYRRQPNTQYLMQ